MKDDGNDEQNMSAVQTNDSEANKNKTTARSGRWNPIGNAVRPRTAALLTNRWLHIGTLVLSMIIHSPAVGADTGSEPERFKKLLVEIHGNLARMHTSSDGFPYHDVFADHCEGSAEWPTEGDILREQGIQAGKISGLELKGMYNTGKLAESEDDEGGRGNLELSWNVLKEGYRQNALRAKAKDLQARLADLDQELERLTNENRCRRYRVRRHFTHKLIRLLQLKLRLMEPVYQIERRAYFKHWSFLDDYLVSEEDLMLTRYELESLLGDPYHDSAPVYRATPPILNVDLAGLLAAVRDDNRYDQLFAAEKEWLKMEQAADIRDSLRIYLRKDFDVESGNQDRDDLIAGIRFTVPLYSRKNDVLQLKLKRVERARNRFLADRIDRVRGAYAALQEQLHRAVRQQYRQARAYERLRRTLWLVGNDEDRSLTAAITRMRTLIEARIELVRVKEELYRRVNEIFLVAQSPYRPDLISVVPLQTERNRARFGTRSLYIWSDEFNGMENKDLLAFLEAKQVSSVYLSGGRKTDAAKLDRFLDQLAARHISADLIVGDNDWIYRTNHKKAVARSVLAAEKTGRLHFDVEPQALPDHRKQPQQDLVRFIELVNKTKEALLDRKLSVAVPFHWPAEIYRELDVAVDTLCVMAYGTDKPETLIRRMQPILQSISPEKIVVVLRADDFDDEWEIEQMIERILSETPVDRFAVHELGSFLAKAVSPYEIEN